MEKVGFGGSCHWCTEAIFQSLNGVSKVEQGWINSNGLNSDFSEGIIVHFDSKVVALSTLVAIHLYTHSCTANHSMRNKYRSAAYTYSEEQLAQVEDIIVALQSEYDQSIITKALPYNDFKINKETYLDYYYKKPENAFCQTYINPKLKLLRSQFSKAADNQKLKHLG